MSDLLEEQNSVNTFDNYLTEWGITKDNLYEYGPSATTLIAKVGSGLSTLDQTSSGFLTKASDWFQSYADFYEAKASHWIK
jgi:hypothetical protein